MNYQRIYLDFIVFHEPEYFGHLVMISLEKPIFDPKDIPTDSPGSHWQEFVRSTSAHPLARLPGVISRPDVMTVTHRGGS